MSNVYYNLAANDADPQLPLGTTYTNPSTGYTYAYGQVAAASANACSDGRVMFETTSFGVWSDDIDVININEPAGIGIGTITKEYYGWIMVDGYHATIKKLVSTGKTLTAGMALVGGNASQDGTVKGQTAGQAVRGAVIAVARAQVTGLATTVTGYVRLGARYIGRGKSV